MEKLGNPKIEKLRNPRNPEKMEKLGNPKIEKLRNPRNPEKMEKLGNPKIEKLTNPRNPEKMEKRGNPKIEKLRNPRNPERMEKLGNPKMEKLRNPRNPEKMEKLEKLESSPPSSAHSRISPSKAPGAAIPRECRTRDQQPQRAGPPCPHQAGGATTPAGIPGAAPQAEQDQPHPFLGFFPLRWDHSLPKFFLFSQFPFHEFQPQVFPNPPFSHKFPSHDSHHPLDFPVSKISPSHLCWEKWDKIRLWTKAAELEAFFPGKPDTFSSLSFTPRRKEIKPPNSSVIFVF
uniref:sporozoite surface protein 2-like n=1 Tax=Lonchura striata TaxID=40157 RepID=UPI000B4DC29F|nr:sporozoite surface protein 2-like [Lonchura striata domestica]